MRLRSPIPATLMLTLSTFFINPVWAAEKDELALMMKQFDQVQAALERARVLANQDNNRNRFYFDYLRASKEIEIIRKGVSGYLEPSRAQPTVPIQSQEYISGVYRKEQR
ncbi:RAQPRD family integrative conjugative element protein [Xenorhabdus bovienii]|uniref:integrative conjugative element protein, RAQPRD family n=1 Tax=Xenorhabdus bovienii TaxID=40576 RepID=UPI00237C630A|nr:RAQPRD family integrative conjugative element protein [Xenorhabdus bovienii]MDE1485149.1 RAQPRD family integrative conjugative element protein [Xenorhabdus bovienii]MDE9476012.1 RAQPRD family integrative conjugative element protein [Xenorhabdus bovienii]MDE9528780.1 RAQPRD family integrative conjugative element protein [Xenorhabdus bovienii]